MSAHGKLKTVAALFLLVLLAFPRPALAYVDPGTGGMVLQLLLAGLAGVGAASIGTAGGTGGRQRGAR